MTLMDHFLMLVLPGDRSTGRMFYSGFRYTLKKRIEPVLTKGKIVTEVIKVDGVCGMCKERIEKAVNELPGIKISNWDVYLKELIVRYNKTKTTNDQIQAKIVGVGHDTEKYKATDKVYNTLHGCCKYRDEDVIKDHEEGED